MRKVFNASHVFSRLAQFVAELKTFSKYAQCGAWRWCFEPGHHSNFFSSLRIQSRSVYVWQCALGALSESESQEREE